MTQSANSAISPIIADVHMHTSHSHGVATTRDMYQSACQKGLSIIGFSEHSPRPEGYCYPSDYQEKLRAQFPQYVSEVLALKEEGASKNITVLLGLEVDYLPEKEAFARQLINEYPYDYIIGGLHFLHKWGFDGPAQEWESLSRDERFSVYAQYYKDLARMCHTGLFHIAAHPDLVKLHSIDDFRDWLGTAEALPLIQAALTAIKVNNMAMEISSAGLRKNCQEIYPGPVIMSLAAHMKLPISFGADAHCTDTPAYAFDQLARYAASFGYTHSLIFKNGKAEQIPFSAPTASPFTS